jgi:hypothetical protein
MEPLPFLLHNPSSLMASLLFTASVSQNRRSECQSADTHVENPLLALDMDDKKKMSSRRQNFPWRLHSNTSG